MMRFTYVNVRKGLLGFLVALLGLMVCAACASSKNLVSLLELSGEWDIIEIDQTAVVPATGQAFPFIGFDSSRGLVHGNAGCNLLTGTFTVNESEGLIDLSHVGCTRMLCADMRVEDAVLSALAKVERYERIDDDHIILYGSSKKRAMVLQRRQSTM